MGTSPGPCARPAHHRTTTAPTCSMGRKSQILEYAGCGSTKPAASGPRGRSHAPGRPDESNRSGSGRESDRGQVYFFELLVERGDIVGLELFPACEQFAQGLFQFTIRGN